MSDRERKKNESKKTKFIDYKIKNENILKVERYLASQNKTKKL